MNSTSWVDHSSQLGQSADCQLMEVIAQRVQLVVHATDIWCGCRGRVDSMYGGRYETKKVLRAVVTLIAQSKVQGRIGTHSKEKRRDLMKA
jgi:hypothetical protein